MELEKAKKIADEIVSRLRPYCDAIAIAGSIRRKRPWVNDIDVVLIPNNQGQIIFQLMQMGGLFKLAGKKLLRYQMPEITVDIYLATSDTWATLLLIRTGSKAHNIRLAKLARARGLKLHADGTGLTRNGDRIAGDNEARIFQALGLRYLEPEERET